MAKRKGGGLFDLFDVKGQPKAGPPDPMPGRLLAVLREGPKHRDWLWRDFPAYKEVIEQLRAAGHVIKSISFPNRADDWVYALCENGRVCGVEGKAGEDPDTAKKE
jgi:hypothetical protein